MVTARHKCREIVSCNYLVVGIVINSSCVAWMISIYIILFVLRITDPRKEHNRVRKFLLSILGSNILNKRKRVSSD